MSIETGVWKSYKVVKVMVQKVFKSEKKSQIFLWLVL